MDRRSKDLPLSRLDWALLSLALIVAWCMAISTITGSEITKDASEDLWLALNIAHHGVMSLDEAPPYRPSMEREPVAVAVLAATVLVTDAIAGPVPSQLYFSGTRAQQLKLGNLLWLSLLIVVTFFATRHFTSNDYIAVAAAIVVSLHFTVLVPMVRRQSLGFDTLLTELAGAAVLTSASWVLARGIASGRTGTLIAAGILFGIAALTKASVFYVFIGLLALGAIWLGMVSVRIRSPWPLTGLLVLAVPFFLTTSFWMYRNYVQTGYWQISERGGQVLMYRALMDEMTPQEIVGAFVIWSEPHLSRLLGRFTGYTNADLRVGGPLQRLSEATTGEFAEREQQAEEAGQPAEAVSWWRKSRALFEAYQAESARQGIAYPSGEADLRTRREAIQKIAHTPVKHAALMPLLMWRGAPVIFAILLITVVYAWRLNRFDLLVLVMPGAGLAIFYSAASQFTSRFAEPIYPIGVIALLILATAAPILTGSQRTRTPMPQTALWHGPSSKQR